MSRRSAQRSKTDGNARSTTPTDRAHVDNSTTTEKNLSLNTIGVARPENVLALQHSVGNRATTHMLARQAAPAGNIQRLLITSRQLKSIIGQPKQDVLWVRMSQLYKAVLAALDDYHTYIMTTNVQVATITVQQTALRGLLDGIVRTCANYTSGHASTEERFSTIFNLVNDATAEKRNVNQVASVANGPTAHLIDGQPWRAVIKDGQFGEDGGLGATPPTAATIEREPGVEAKFSRDTAIYAAPDLAGAATAQAANSDLCMRSDVKGHPRILYVEKYEMSGKNVLVKAAGYVPSATVGKSKVNHTEVAADVPIFKGIPTLEDIQQGAIGDCYLVAAIGAIVQNTPDLIYNMVRDNRDGSVTVRLYDTAVKPVPAPTYITVKKSLVNDGRRSKGALWVAFLEKAYAVMGRGAGGAVTSQSYQQMGTGEQSSTAFAILTGQQAQSRGVRPGDGVFALGQRFWGKGQMLNYERKMKPRKQQGALSGTDRQVYETMDGYLLFGNDQEADALMDWIIGPGNAFAARLEAADKKGTIHAFIPVLDDIDLAGALTPRMRKVLRDTIVARYPGFRGSARYTTFQIATYDQIELAVGQRQYVAAGTGDRVGKSDAKVGHSGGESRSRGIVGGHAYTVLSVRTDAATGLRYVRLRNPWGDYNREYSGINPTTGKLELNEDIDHLETLKGPFELELTDFSKRYTNLYYG